MLSLTMEIGDHNWWCSHQHFYSLNKSDLSMASYRHGIRYVFTCAPKKLIVLWAWNHIYFTCTNLRRFRVTHNWCSQFDNNKKISSIWLIHNFWIFWDDNFGNNDGFSMISVWSITSPKVTVHYFICLTTKLKITLINKFLRWECNCVWEVVV